MCPLMAGAPWRRWGIIVRHCSDSAKEVSRRVRAARVRGSLA